MKTIDLGREPVTLKEVLRLAADENLLLRTETGEEFVVAGVDSLDEEIEAIRRQPELMRLLAERSRERATVSLEEVKRQLGVQ